jgi:class 3 adenylate cyclase
MAPESFKRKLTAILSADVKGYSRLMGENEAETVKNIAKQVGAYRVLMEPRVMVAGAKEKKAPAPLWRRKGILAGAMAATNY